MPLPPTPDWAKLTEATYPNLSEAEREVLRKIWATNYQNFEALKLKINGELDPDPVFDPSGSGSLGEVKA
ncbi:hypothetical protein [Bryobacter aggregatus]|uniref:hypothetical protein n=1 Tax=Bryobacter aggregatus TaxID=360054 RepID=UPI00138DD983|nr:hypothetical protein [Bryobacter aggregatus]